jgi:hypothetical protein
MFAEWRGLSPMAKTRKKSEGGQLGHPFHDDAAVNSVAASSPLNNLLDA